MKILFLYQFITVCFLLTGSVSVDDDGGGSCDPGSGRQCTSATDCPANEVCDLKVNQCVTDNRVTQ
jgi:hypothetical protein